jgi:DNA polymerase-3 subunit gamma/tau
VIEIDAASNTGVDNIRELIERAQFSPVQCRYKVYIIDEVHMLSTAAFNALLKTLEEPPKHVVFVLATTDPQRVLPTIISRCQKFDFRRIPLEAMVKHLSDIASKENINIAPDAITLVAQVAQGGLRDAESLLDQLSLLPGEVTVEAVWDLVGAVPEQDLMALTKAIASNKSEDVLDHCRHLMDRGREPLVVLQNLAGFYRDLLIAKTAPTRSDLVAVTPPTWNQLREFAQQLEVSTILQGQQHLKDSESQIKNTTQPRLWLEVTLLGLLPSANLPQPASTTSQPLLRQSEVNRQESQTRGETSVRPQALTPPVAPPNSPTSQATPDSRQSETQPPQEATAPTSDPNRNQVSDPQHQQAAVATAKESSASSSASTPEQPSYSEQTIDQIWQQVLKHLHPFSAYALVSQHCYLLSFERSVAYIGISTQPLLKLAQEKLPNLVAAFEAVYKSQVKVILEIKPSKSSKSSKTTPASRISVNTPAVEELGVKSSPTFSGNADAPNVGNSRSDYSRAETAERSEYQRVSTKPSETAANEPKFESRLLEQIPQATVTRLATNSSLTLAERQVLPELQPQEQVETDYSNLTTEINQSQISLPVQEVDWDADEVEKALRNLKQFFEGEFVDLTDEFSNTNCAASALAEPHGAKGDYESTITHQLQESDVIDAGTYQHQLDPEEYWEEEESIEQAATHHVQSSEIAAFDNTQTQLRRENWPYDENGELAF